MGKPVCIFYCSILNISFIIHKTHLYILRLSLIFFLNLGVFVLTDPFHLQLANSHSSFRKEVCSWDFFSD